LAHLERQIGGIQNRIRTTNNAIRDVQVQKDSTQSTLNNKRNELHNKERQRDAANAESARARERRDGARAAGVGLGILSIFAGPLAPVVFAATAGSLAYASDQDNVARARQNEANVLRQECQTLEIQIGGQNDRLAAHNHDLQRSQNERSQAEQEKAALEREQSAQRAEKQILVNLEARVADLGTQVPSLNGKTATLSSEISAIRTHTMNCTVMISEARVKAGCLEYADSRNEILGTVKTMVSGFPIGGGVVERIGAVIGELERRSLAAAH
jgi:chromosome segregation ATPase